MLVTAEYFRLATILHKMVLNNQITSIEREALLHKSGLIKLEDNRWKEPEGAILTMDYDSNKQRM
jgi:hypothetical protein